MDLTRFGSGMRWNADLANFAIVSFCIVANRRGIADLWCWISTDMVFAGSESQKLFRTALSCTMFEVKVKLCKNAVVLIHKRPSAIAVIDVIDPRALTYHLD